MSKTTMTLWGVNEAEVGEWHHGKVTGNSSELLADCGVKVRATGWHGDMRSGHPWAAKYGVCSECEQLSESRGD